MSSNSNSGTPISSNRWQATSTAESRKLSYKESDWNLSSTSIVTTRTRHGGKGRPNLKRKDALGSSSSESEDDSYEPNKSDDDDDISEDEAEELEPETSRKPPATRVILEVGPLKQFVDELCKCHGCNGPLDIETQTTCVASHVKATCLDPSCGFILHGNPPASTTMHEKNNDNHNRNTDHAVNALCVLGMICNGDGCTEASRMLGLMGLPNDATMDGRSFHVIEERIGPLIRNLTDEIMLENLTEEVRLSTANESDFDTWKRAIDPDVATPPLPIERHPRVNASNDTAWQQKGSGHTHNSPSGHSLMFGHHTRKPLAYVVKSKVCNCCNAFTKKNGNIDVPPHDCCKNHKGSSGAMEPDSCLELIVSLFDKCKCILNLLCCDDDSSVRADCRWSNPAFLSNNPGVPLPMVKKKVGKNKGELQERPNKGKLPGHMPEPAFVADPNHRRKQLTGELIALAKANVASKMTMTRMDATRTGKNFGCMARSLKTTTADEYVNRGKAALEHHFDNHEHCGSCCSRRLESEAQRMATKKHCRCKTRDGKLCCLLQEMLLNYVAMERLSDIAHGMDANCCKAFNDFMTWFAPKNKVYSGSRSLWNRVGLCIGTSSIGHLQCFQRLFKKMGIAMTPNVMNFLDVKNRSRTKRLDLAKEKKSKKERNKRKHDKLVECTAIARK